MNKGFTLIELVAVIGIILVLALIVVINVTGYINRAGETSYNTLVKSVKDAAELYVAEHDTEFPQLDVIGSTFDISLQNLVDDGYLKDKLVDDRTSNEISLSTPVHITVIGDNKISVDFSVD